MGKSFTSYSTNQSGAEKDAEYKASSYRDSMVAEANSKRAAAEARKDYDGVNLYTELAARLAAG
jgi:hypothetical protein